MLPLGTKAPDFALPNTVDGRMVSLSDVADAPAANPEQSFIRTGYSEQQEGSTAVLMAERALGDAQGRHAIARTPRARIGQLSTWSLGCGFDSAVGALQLVIELTVEVLQEQDSYRHRLA